MSKVQHYLNSSSAGPAPAGMPASAADRGCSASRHRRQVTLLKLLVLLIKDTWLCRFTSLCWWMCLDLDNANLYLQLPFPLQDPAAQGARVQDVTAHACSSAGRTSCWLCRGQSSRACWSAHELQHCWYQKRQVCGRRQLLVHGDTGTQRRHCIADRAKRDSCEL